MLKEKTMISDKQAESLIYNMTKYSNHTYTVKNLTNSEIQRWFEQNGYCWKILVPRIRNMNNPIPFVENLIDYTFTLAAPDSTSITIYQCGHKTAELQGFGEISIFDYYTKFIKSLEDRKVAIKKSSYSALLSCITHAIASIESYITNKAILWNKQSNQPFIEVKNISNLDEKLNNWLFVMAGRTLDKGKGYWNDFMDYKKLNNSFKHNSTGSQAASYNDMIKLLNKFRTGIAKLLFELHRLFNESIPSKIIRGIYLPDIFITK